MCSRHDQLDIFRIGWAKTPQLSILTTNATRIVSTPAFEPRKQPADVYRRLTQCYKLIHQIAELSNLEMLSLDVSDTEFSRVTPGDVHVIASLVVSELAYLHARLPDANPARDVHNPGRKFPSHVYQRAGILEGQLQELLSYVQKTPGWLSGTE